MTMQCGVSGAAYRASLASLLAGHALPIAYCNAAIPEYIGVLGMSRNFVRRKDRFSRNISPFLFQRISGLAGAREIQRDWAMICLASECCMNAANDK
jgi:hypothetical protein